jgi:hypothetical protein
MRAARLQVLAPIWSGEGKAALAPLLSCLACCERLLSSCDRPAPPPRSFSLALVCSLPLPEVLRVVAAARQLGNKCVYFISKAAA